MIEHPCANGLSKACFAQYPKWAYQAFSYKLLHTLLPKQLSRKLPKGLNRGLVGPGAVVPPGVVFPPGLTIPPGFTWPEKWSTWLYFIFEGDVLPWLVFPEDWTPEDPLPPGVTLAPDVVLPPDFKPADHPPAYLIPGYTPVSPPPTSGAPPPLYVQPWEPGPIKRSPQITPIVWVSIFDPICWESAPSHCGPEPMMSWVADMWLAENCGSGEDLMLKMLQPTTPEWWSLNYRPTKARITFIDTIPPTRLGFLDTSNFLIAYNMAPVSPQVFTFNWSHGNDIGGLSIYSLGTYITNIEFC